MVDRNIVKGVFGVVIVAGIIYVIYCAISKKCFHQKQDEEKKDEIQDSTDSQSQDATTNGDNNTGGDSSTASGSAVVPVPASPSTNVYADRTPDLATEDANSQQFHDVEGIPPHGAQPIETDYSSVAGANRQNAPDDQWAPVDAMTQNDALSQANAENAQWFSGNLLPNAELQCNNDGMITDGPTYEELAIFTPRLLEASVASRYFMDPPIVRRPCGGDNLRPIPMISSSAGSRENLVWGISSIQQSDVALQNAAAQRVFC